ncbi:hypothetical protein [Legionella bononiensis]|uniref:Uncharacterized protein n=1 Tax=Legionella bononiensis TaxID=2793102 RepID=A0ABS1WDY9_9GAMM|nr:hypothetical protein [Legionella bononiensis]MBL7479553.1 hypothetical protein [Legionella bononiensis]MBL7527573.1 hypothetical protein [Legionella bononiensis]
MSISKGDSTNVDATKPEDIAAAKTQYSPNYTPYQRRVGIQGNNIDLILVDYKKKYCGEPNNYPEPKQEKGSTRLLFPSPEDLATFIQDQASQGRGFTLTDGQGRVMAYSNGDGKLYKADNTVYGPGEKLVASDIPIRGFSIPPIQSQQEVAAVTTEDTAPEKKGSYSSDKVRQLISTQLCRVTEIENHQELKGKSHPGIWYENKDSKQASIIGTNDVVDDYIKKLKKEYGKDFEIGSEVVSYEGKELVQLTIPIQSLATVAKKMDYPIDLSGDIPTESLAKEQNQEREVPLDKRANTEDTALEKKGSYSSDKVRQLISTQLCRITEVENHQELKGKSHPGIWYENKDGKQASIIGTNDVVDDYIQKLKKEYGKDFEIGSEVVSYEGKELVHLTIPIQSLATVAKKMDYPIDLSGDIPTASLAKDQSQEREVPLDKSVKEVIGQYKPAFNLQPMSNTTTCSNLDDLPAYGTSTQSVENDQQAADANDENTSQANL